MFAIYVPTIYAFTTLVSASLGGLLMWLWRRDPTQPALAYWGATRILGLLVADLVAGREAVMHPGIAHHALGSLFRFAGR